MGTNANDNATYNLVELDGLRLAMPIAGKRVKILKKTQDEDPNIYHLDDEHNRADVNEDIEKSD